MGKTGLSVEAINSYQVGPGFTEKFYWRIKLDRPEVKGTREKSKCQKGTGLMKMIVHVNVILIHTCLLNVLDYMKNWKYSTEFHMINEDNRCEHIYMSKNPLHSSHLKTSSVHLFA